MLTKPQAETKCPECGNNDPQQFAGQDDGKGGEVHYCYPCEKRAAKAPAKSLATK